MEILPLAILLVLVLLLWSSGRTYTFMDTVVRFRLGHWVMIGLLICGIWATLLVYFSTLTGLIRIISIGCWWLSVIVLLVLAAYFAFVNYLDRQVVKGFREALFDN